MYITYCKKLKLIKIMLLSSLLLIPITGIFLISSTISYQSNEIDIKNSKIIALTTSIINLIVSFIIYLLAFLN